MKLIYPDKRQISDEEVISWARDLRVTAAMNGDTSYESVAAWSAEQKTTIITISVPDPTLEEAVAELNDAGVATFAKD